MAENDPFAQTYMNPNASRMGLYDLRMMSAANRAEAPFDRVRSYGHQGIGGNPMLASMMGGGGGTDYSQFTFDPAARAAASSALSPYGLAPLEANQVQRNTILPNTGFFGNHPRLSAALEGGAYGAMAAHGGTTAGDTIQGSLEGIIGGRQLQRAAYNRQFAKPFEAAGAMERLEDMRQKRDLQEAEIQHYRAVNQKLGRPDHAYQIHPLTKSDPGYVTTDVETGESRYSTNPDYDPALVKTQRNANEWSGYGTDRTAIANELFGDKGPHELNHKEWTMLNREYERRVGMKSYTQGQQGTAGRLSVQGELTPQQKEHIDTIRAQMNKLDSKETTSLLRQQVMLDDKFKGKSLADQTAEVEARRESKRQTLQGQIDTIMNPGQAAPPEAAGKGKVLVEGKDF